MLTVFTPPAGLEWSRPRAVRLTGTGRFVAALIVTLLIAAPGVGLLIARESYAAAARRQQIETASVVTSGVVTRLTKESKDSNSGNVFYEFEADGRRYDGHMRIRRSWWRMLSVGDPLAVRYATAAPSNNVPDGQWPRVTPLWLSWLVGLAIAGSAALLGVKVQREWQLLAEGRIAEGTVRAVKVSRSQHGTHRSISYDFALLSGARQTGSHSVSRTPPEVGSSVVVIYDAERPKRNKTYPFSLVTTVRS